MRDVKNVLGVKALLDLLGKKCKYFASAGKNREYGKFPSPAEMYDCMNADGLEEFLKLFGGYDTDWVYHIGYNFKYDVDLVEVYDTWDKALAKSMPLEETEVSIHKFVSVFRKDLIEYAFSNKELCKETIVLDDLLLEKDTEFLKKIGVTDKKRLPELFLSTVREIKIEGDCDFSDADDGYVRIPMKVKLDGKLLDMLLSGTESPVALDSKTNAG